MNLLLTILLLVPALAQAQTSWFSDHFNRKEPGARWQATTGSWKITANTLGITTADYDQLLSSDYYVYGTGPYSIEVVLRGTRAGLFFNLEKRDAKAISHMVRFDEKSLMAGYMDGNGTFVPSGVYDIDKMPTDWTRLRIDVNPANESYSLFVDGKKIGDDNRLTFPSGFVGLQASDGTSEFRSITVVGKGKNTVPAKPAIGKPVMPRHLGFVQALGESLAIYDSERGVLQTLDKNGLLASELVLKMKPAPQRGFMIGEQRYMIEGRKILVTNESGAILDSLTEHFIAPTCIITDAGIVKNENPSIYVADPGANAILKLSTSGQLLEMFDASSMGGMLAPRAIDFYGDRELVIADVNRLIFVDRSLKDAQSLVQPLSPTAMQILWQRNDNTQPFAEYAVDATTWKHITGKVRGRWNEVAIDSLAPLTRYSFKLSSGLRTIPVVSPMAKEFRFATPSSDSTMMMYTRLHVLCMVYRTISYHDVYPADRYPQIPAGRTISDEEIDYLKQAIKFNSEFYFRNSSCRLVLDFDFAVVSDTLWLHELGDKDPYWLSCNERVTRDFEKVAASLGKKPEAYNGLICPYAWINYPPRRKSALSDPSRTDSINIRQAYGGGTNGVPAPWKYGKTTGYTGNPFQDKFSRQDWLITHEFHHQIDALMEASGYPEYYHADQPWKMPGPFGEDFDFNARIIRNAQAGWWLTLKAGELQQTRDADFDGVPDDDPTLPFDEKRLNGNPRSVDTDGDQLPDLYEVMAGDEHNSGLNVVDTDGDSLRDGIDPEPLYPIQPVLHKGTKLRYFGTLRSDSLTADIGCAWAGGLLQFSFAPTRNGTEVPKFNVLLQIDGANDGWFHGFDNWQIRVAHTPDSTKVIDYYLRDCSSWIDPPKDRKDILSEKELVVGRLSPLAFDSSYHGATTGLIVAIPTKAKYGLGLYDGKQMRIRIGIQTVDDRWVWNELFERNYMMEVELK
jgi:hypothetical protein